MKPYSLESSFHNHFAFLLDQYGFLIIEERYHQAMDHAIIVFSKPPTLIEVVKDRGQILASFGDEHINRFEWVEFAHAVQFLSRNSEPVYSFPSIYNDETEDIQISHISEVMRKYCLPILSGEMTIKKLKEAMKAKQKQDMREYFASLQGNSKTKTNL